MTQIFDTALMMLDDDARPVLLIPDTMPEGDAFLHIVSDGIDIGVNDKIYGSLREMEDEELTLLSLHPTVDIATFDPDKDETLPETADHTATITDKR